MRPDRPLIRFFDVPDEEARYFINQYSLLAYLIQNPGLHQNFFPRVRPNTSVIYHYYNLDWMEEPLEVNSEWTLAEFNMYLIRRYVLGSCPAQA